MNFAFQNQWIGIVTGQYVHVYVGTYDTHPERGVLLITLTALNHKSVPDSLRTYDPVLETGSLKIEGEQANVLTLSTASGASLLFDVAARLFLDPATLLPLPTVTPVATPTPPPIIVPDPIAVFAVDTDVNGIPANTATSFGTIEKCRQVQVGEVFDIDVVIGGIPPAVVAEGGLLGFGFTLGFNGNVRVVGANSEMLLAANAGSSLFKSNEALPVEDGNFSVGVLDVGQGSAEGGAGVLIRITLEAREAGISTLDISDLEIVDSGNSLYPVPQLTDASRSVIKVGPYTCP